MPKKVNPVILDLIYDALIKCFWRKEALKRFLRSAGIAGNYIAQMDMSESKRTWLDRLFPILTTKDKGPELLLAMARTLASMNHFPDLQSWEDSSTKIEAAKAAVRRLAEAIGAEDEKSAREDAANETKRKAEEKRKAKMREYADLTKLKARMDALATQIGTQQAGYDFQDWFYDLLNYEDIDNRRPYTAEGRQIDGSLTLDGTTYLVELKFEAKQAGAPHIDSLKAKINSKADNTMGIMVPMSGYSFIAMKEASGPKTALLLFDYSHVYMVLEGVSSMKEIIRRVRRHSSQTGQAFLAATDFGG
jgi:hypothetical protein